MKRRQFLKLFAVGTVGILSLDAFWWERTFIEFKDHIVSSGKEGASFKFVQISDLHLQGINLELKKAAEKLNSLQPDLIVLTGDSIDEKDNLGMLNDFLGLLDKKIPKAASLGNWDRWSKVDIDQLREVYQKNNTDLLVNEHTVYSIQGKQVLISGVDDLISGKPDFDKAVSGHPPFDYHILLNHCPVFRDIIAERVRPQDTVDLVLSGHTHGGQVNVLGFVPYLPPGSGRYLKGWYKDVHPPMYVSGGIGTTFLPIRFGSRAEISVFTVTI